VKRKSLNYYLITYGGVPLTRAGTERFARAAIFYGKYTADEVNEFLNGGN